MNIFHPTKLFGLGQPFWKFWERKRFWCFQIAMLSRISCLLPKGTFYILAKCFRNSNMYFVFASNVVKSNYATLNKYIFLCWDSCHSWVGCNFLSNVR